MTDSARLLVARASSLIDINRAADAVVLLHRAVSLAPDDQSAWCELARAELSCDRPRQALPAVNRALALDPSDEWPHRVAGIALGRLGDHDAALRAAREAVRLAPHAWQTHDQLAEAIDDHPQPLWHRRQLRAEAWTAANRAVRLAPQEPEPHCTVGHLCLTNKAWRQAELAFREALRLDPGYARALNGLGLASLRSGRLLAAAAEFGAAAAVDPRDPAARRNISAAAWNATQALVWGLLVTVFAFTQMVPLPVLVGRIFIALVVIALVLAGGLLWRRVPGRLRGHLLRLPRRDIWLGATLAWAATTFILMSAGALPTDRGIRSGLAGLALLSALATFVPWRLGVRRHNRR